MKRLILRSLGYVMLAVPFVGCVSFIAAIGGLIPTLYILGFVLFVLGWIWASVRLIETN